MKRRIFLKTTGAAGILSQAQWGNLLSNGAAFGEEANLSWVEARYYEKLPDREIECFLCPRQCRLGDRERGYCGVRENKEGIYYTLVYGKACTIHVDPIEKKPFFHYLQESRTLSLATAGCNVNCKFCQNWELSQVRPEQVRHLDFPPEEVARTAHEYNCPVIAYTYTEPVVFFEYMVDTAKIARSSGLKNVVVTGGHISREPLQELIREVDAIKVDLKAFNQKFYSNYVRGELQPVLEAIQAVAQSPAWLEIVYLVIPTLNDSAGEIRKLSQWIMEEVGPDIPLHFSRFHPTYLLKNLPPTPVSTLEKCRQIAMDEGIHFVYIGNVPGHKGENTYCPSCGKLLIQRRGFEIRQFNLVEERCPQCRKTIPGVWL
ncbi:MAG: AmmeMemoRadiSam system radical SAM enzyme [Acidobacteriota bacterium]